MVKAESSRYESCNAHSARTNVDESTGQAPTRARWGAISHLVGILAFAGMCMAFTLFMVVGYVTAYQYLTGPYCNHQLMGPEDTCSITSYFGGRGQHDFERLNPPGQPPVVAPLPARVHPSPEKVRRHVYSQSVMRDYHRSLGYFLLGGSTMFALILGSFAYRGLRPRKTPRTSLAVDGLYRREPRARRRAAMSAYPAPPTDESRGGRSL
ncbi:MAG: hypothetical protein PHQ28_00755 [Mycobacterium sp.]|nr:hypothetical protein [Mycobacterium sp.]